jgi:hypothetical protein
VRIHTQSGVSELRHVRASDRYEACSAQSRYGGCIRFGRGLTTQDRGAGSRDVTCEIEQILDGYGNARVRRWLYSMSTQSIATVGRSSRAIGMYLDEGTPTLACGVGYSAEAFFHQPAAAGRACAQVPGEFGESSHERFPAGFEARS